MKQLIIMLLICTSVIPAFGQKDDDKAKQRDEKRKAHFEWFIAKRQEFLTREAEISEQEAKLFFPLYNEMQEKKFKINADVHNEIRKINQSKEVSDKDYEKITDLMDEIPLKEAQLAKEYSAKFKKILSPQKLFKFKLAEAKFTREVLNRPPKEWKDNPNKKEGVEQKGEQKPEITKSNK